jgi:cobalt-zinc-cadmium efflux system outer membrane protein
MLRWDRERERREGVVELEDAQGLPNVVARAGLRRLNEPDENAFVANLTVPIPLFDRNQGARAAARSDVRRASFERRSAEIQLSAQLSAAYQDLVSRYEELSELRRTVLPGAREAFEGVRQGFRQGLFRNLDVLDAQRRLFELRVREIEAARSYEAARAVVDQLAGGASRSVPQETTR